MNSGNFLEFSFTFFEYTNPRVSNEYNRILKAISTLDQIDTSVLNIVQIDELLKFHEQQVLKYYAAQVINISTLFPFPAPFSPSLRHKVRNNTHAHLFGSPSQFPIPTHSINPWVRSFFYFIYLLSLLKT